MNETTRRDEEQPTDAATAVAEDRGDERVELRCPNCDHPVISVPRGHKFKERRLICPGCGAHIEPPDLSREGGKLGVLDLLKRFLRS